MILAKGKLNPKHRPPDRRRPEGYQEALFLATERDLPAFVRGFRRTLRFHAPRLVSRQHLRLDQLHIRAMKLSVRDQHQISHHVPGKGTIGGRRSDHSNLCGIGRAGKERHCSKSSEGSKVHGEHSKKSRRRRRGMPTLRHNTVLAGPRFTGPPRLSHPSARRYRRTPHGRSASLSASGVIAALRRRGPTPCRRGGCRARRLGRH